MSGLVERLRNHALNLGGPPEDHLTWQAADEIERLRAALKEALALGDVAASAAGVVIRRALEESR
jgi:hypothetical protein